MQEKSIVARSWRSDAALAVTAFRHHRRVVLIWGLHFNWQILERARAKVI